MNKVIVIGNVASDVELRKTQSGVSVCTFKLAVQRKFKNAAGEREADFLSIVTWRQLADLCGKYLAKGRKCAVIGSLQTRSYDAQDGSKRYATEVVAEEVEFLTPRDATAQKPAEGVTECVDKAADGSGFTEVDDSDLPF